MSENKQLSFTDFRARVGDLRGKEFWRSLEELSRSDAFDEFFAQEFPQQAVPLEKGVDRRDFLKLMSASVAMAGLTACRQPADAIVPYVNQPESIIPGKPIYFASAMTLNGVATGVLVESHMNRPTKIEGNPEHPSSLGASDAFMQASVLGLYDPDRSQVIRKLGDTSTWGDFIGAVQPVLTAAKANGAGLRILTQTTSSPTFGAQMQALLAQYPDLKWHQWEAVNRDGVREGGRLAFGRYVNTYYDFTKANVVVSLGSDFLGEGPGHLRYARDFMSRRKVRTVGVAPLTSMNRLYAIEGSMSNTGSVADHRIAVKPSQIEAIARGILAGSGTSPVLNTLIKDLQANRGASIVIAGEEQSAEVHAIAHAINTQLGNIGTTVLVTDPIEVAPVNQLASLQELVRDMNAGAVNALIILSGNPVFDAPADLQFAKALDKVPFRAHHSLYYDETSLRCHWHIPETHYLETWGDARAHDGTISIVQPLIAPLYNGRSASEVLGTLIGGLDQTPYQAVRAYWQSQGATDATWRKWLHDGVIAGSALAPIAVAATAPPPASNQQPATGFEIELRHDPTIYDGRFANNGWLQELPKPQTKITWDNVLIVSPKTATKIGYDPEERDSLVNEKQTRFACIGCNACVVACQAENNIPVVGKEQVLRGREMHWLRVDRYFAATSTIPTRPTPAGAVHAVRERAVRGGLPGGATTSHSDEGLNDMVYNRCVGTRYCSNNCPYKVRRFNFLLYQDWDTPSLKLMRNPDVTVRSRGVMEKCTYCVQRINATRRSTPSARTARSATARS
jgi:MoCo/4Fe-4S cofactor protein with predicted Tat translocation signal